MSKNQTMRADALGLLAWFLVFVLSERLAIRLSKAQSKEKAGTPAGCTDSGRSLLLEDRFGADPQAGKDAEHHYAQGLQVESAGDNAG